MMTAPTLHTEQLILRSFSLDDAQDVQRLAGERDIAANLTNMPHPYEDGMAEEWIRSCYEKFENGEEVNFAITLKTTGSLVGGTGLRIEQRHNRAELGYWIGTPYWGNGYATETAQAVVTYAFEELKLNRILAYHYKRNIASERVLQKIGMQYEGCFREHIKKWDVFEDVIGHGMLKADHDAKVV